MNFLSMVRAAAMIAALPVLVAAQDAGQTAPASAGTTTTTKIAVIDIDRIAAESNAGTVLFERLKAENDKIAAERAQKEQAIRDMQAKLTSEILSADAKDRLSREIERGRTDAQRWLEDKQLEFQQKQQEGEAEFQMKLAPVVEEVAKQNGIGLILRATPGLTFVLDPALDITPLVIEAFNKTETQPGGQSNPQTQPQAKN